MGTKAVDVKSTVFKRRLSANGQPIMGVEDENNNPRQLIHAENVASGVRRKLENKDNHQFAAKMFFSLF